MPDAPAAPQQRPFAAFLQDHRQGATHDELSEKLNEIVAGVIEHQKAGSMTLKITVRPASDGVMVIVTDDVTAKVPEADRSASLFFADEHGNLTRRDPRQLDIPALREVPAPRQPLDAAGSEAAQ